MKIISTENQKKILDLLLYLASNEATIGPEILFNQIDEAITIMKPQKKGPKPGTKYKKKVDIVIET